MAESFVCVSGINLEAALYEYHKLLDDLHRSDAVLLTAVIAAALGECIPATVETRGLTQRFDHETREWQPIVEQQRFVSEWQPVEEQ